MGGKATVLEKIACETADFAMLTVLAGADFIDASTPVKP